jgi:predicted nucleotidyltransferase
MSPRIQIDAERIAEFCRRHSIVRLAFFGSVLTDDFRPDSDVDVLVDFEPDREPGLIGLAEMELELSEMLGRKADLRTPEDLSRYFREKVVATAEVLYAA